MALDGIGIVLLKLLLATSVGLILGLEREAKHKPLGLKTCVVISVASCLLTIISFEGAVNSYEGLFFTGIDPMRLPSQILSGIGFLGAGVILRRDNNIIYGLTTAAIVWTAAGFGIAIGAGYYLEVAIGTGLIYFTVTFLPYLMRKIGATALEEQEIYLVLHVEPSIVIDAVVETIKSFVIRVENVNIKGSNDGHRLDMRCFIDHEKDNIFSQYAKIREIPGVIQVEVTKV